MNVCPHPGPTAFGILSTNPNGMSVVDWARELLQMSIPELEWGLAESPGTPSHVFTDAMLTALPHRPRRDGGAAFRGVTLATSRAEFIRALLEAIACELAATIEGLR